MRTFYLQYNIYVSLLSWELALLMFFFIDEETDSEIVSDWKVELMNTIIFYPVEEKEPLKQFHYLQGYLKYPRNSSSTTNSLPRTECDSQ